MKIALLIPLAAAAWSVNTQAQSIQYDQEKARQFRQTLVSGRDLYYPPAAVRLKQGGSGVFVMFLRPDGTVKAVTIAQSTGSSLIDFETKRTLATYRFKPGTIRTQVFPVTFVPPSK